jgi:hypothetical protein
MLGCDIGLTISVRLVNEIEPALDPFDTNLYPIKPTVHAN